MPGPLESSFSLFENGYRWYKPRWGRYGQADPIGILGGIHAFKYADNNPSTIIDPLGLKCGPWNPMGSEYTREIIEYDFMGYEKHWASIITNLPPSRKTPHTPSISICCYARKGSKFDVLVQMVERTCDCCTSRPELRFSGNTNIRIFDTDIYSPNRGPCQTIKQYGRELRSKSWLNDFTEWNLNDCYISTEIDGSCSGRDFGT
jgi:RHS repeat-associated protein